MRIGSRKPDTNPHRYPHHEGERGSYGPGYRCHQVGRGPSEPPSAGSRARGEESAGAGGLSRAQPLAPASHRPRALLAQAQRPGSGWQSEAGRGEAALASPPRRGWGDGHTLGGEFRFLAGAGLGRADGKRTAASARQLGASAGSRRAGAGFRRGGGGALDDHLAASPSTQRDRSPGRAL